jgi:hypothetical protein
LEVSTFEGVCRLGKQAPSWYTSQAGLFSDRPHLTLQENFWDVDQAISTERYYIIDAESESVSSCSSTNQAYTQNQYDHLLKSIGFSNVNFWVELGESNTAVDYDWFGDFISVTARKQSA